MKPHRLITIAAALMLSMAFCSCKVVRASLPDRESLRTLQPLLLRSEKVDSCLEVLRGIDTTLLTRPSDKAKYALLHAMALDKNYIDTTDLSVIAPAVRYYTPWYHFNRAYKFYTWYYKGRIEENGRDYEAALHSLLEAERVMGGTDDLYRTRLYFAFGRVYGYTMSYNQRYESAKRALKYAKSLTFGSYYPDALLDCASTAASVFNHKEAKEYLDLYESTYGGGLNHNYPRYYLTKMHCYEMRESMRDSSKYYLFKYVETGEVKNEVVACLMNCVLRNDYEYGEWLLSKYKDYIPLQGTKAAAFYEFLSVIDENKGDIAAAMYDLRQSQKLLKDEYSYNIFNDISSQALKYQNKYQRINFLLLLLVSIIVIMLVAFTYLTHARKSKYEYLLLKQNFDSVTNEYDMLYGSLWAKDYSGDNIQKVYDRIVEMGVILPGNNTDIRSISSVISDRIGVGRYVEMMCLLTAIYCKSFYKSLVEKKLSSVEITICSMFLMNITTKESSFILKRTGIRNDCSEIRRKLQISKESGYLSEELKRLYSQNNNR